MLDIRNNILLDWFSVLPHEVKRVVFLVVSCPSVWSALCCHLGVAAEFGS